MNICSFFGGCLFIHALFYTVVAIWINFGSFYVPFLIPDTSSPNIIVVAHSPILSPTTTILVFNDFILYILFYFLWCRFRSWGSFRRTSIIRRMHGRLICFPSNLHVTGFSSCWITIMIHSYLVCVGGCHFRNHLSQKRGFILINDGCVSLSLSHSLSLSLSLSIYIYIYVYIYMLYIYI